MRGQGRRRRIPRLLQGLALAVLVASIAPSPVRGFEFFDGTQTPRGQASYAPYDITVVSDGCAGNGGEGGSLNQTTDFEINSVLVPVRNVQCRDCGDVRPEAYGSVLTDNPAWLR